MIVDGRKLADDVLSEAKGEIERLNLKLKLAIILVGDDPVSLSYISQKKKTCAKAGVEFSLHRFPEGIGKDELLAGISEACHGASAAIIQLPLPTGLPGQEILDAVPPEKDADLLNSVSLGRYHSGDLSILPPTVAAIAKVLEGVEIKGKHTVVVGAGRLVGRPLVAWLMAKGATLSVLNSSTPDISEFTKRADIIISGVGQPGLITGKMIKEGAVVIDAGSSVEGGAVKGDVEIESVLPVASTVSPVPGGVGPVTTACLVANMVELYKRYGKDDI